MIDYICSFCKAPLQSPPQHAGIRVGCPYCKAPVVVPGTVAPVEQAPATAIDYACTSCQRPLRSPPEQAGILVVCPYCEVPVPVPGIAKVTLVAIAPATATRPGFRLEDQPASESDSRCGIDVISRGSSRGRNRRYHSSAGIVSLCVTGMVLMILGGLYMAGVFSASSMIDQDADAVELLGAMQREKALADQIALWDAHQLTAADLKPLAKNKEIATNKKHELEARIKQKWSKEPTAFLKECFDRKPHLRDGYFSSDAAVEKTLKASHDRVILESQRAENWIRVQVLSEAKIIPVKDIDRTTWQGEIEYRNAQRMMPFEDERAKLARVVKILKMKEQAVRKITLEWMQKCNEQIEKLIQSSLHE